MWLLYVRRYWCICQFLKQTNLIIFLSVNFEKKMSIQKKWRHAFNLVTFTQRYTYRVLQTIQMKLILLWVWAERAVLGRAETPLKFKYEI